MPHCFITLQHILIKPRKKDQQIFDASCKHSWDSVPIKSMTSTPFGSILHREFISVWDTVLTCVYSLCITYPHNDIVVHANDIKSCFYQIKHHLEVIGYFSYILAEYLFF